MGDVACCLPLSSSWKSGPNYEKKKVGNKLFKCRHLVGFNNLLKKINLANPTKNLPSRPICLITFLSPKICYPTGISLSTNDKLHQDPRS